MSKFFVHAIAPFTGNSLQGQLSFKAGDLLELTNSGCVNISNGWGYGKHIISGHKGWFPASFVRPAQSHPRPQDSSQYSMTPSPGELITPPDHEQINPMYGFKLQGEDLDNFHGLDKYRTVPRATLVHEDRNDDNAVTLPLAIATIHYSSQSNMHHTIRHRNDDDSSLDFDSSNLMGGESTVAATGNGFGSPISHVPVMPVQVVEVPLPPAPTPRRQRQQARVGGGLVTRIGQGISMKKLTGPSSSSTNSSNNSIVPKKNHTAKMPSQMSTSQQKKTTIGAWTTPKKKPSSQRGSFFTPEQHVSTSTTRGGYFGTRATTTTTCTTASRGERTASFVGSNATFHAAQSLAFGNVAGAVVYASMAAGSFALEGKAKKERTASTYSE